MNLTKKNRIFILVIFSLGIVKAQNFGLNIYFSKNAYGKGIFGANKGVRNFDTSVFSKNSNTSEAIFDYGIGLSYNLKLNQSRKLKIDLNWEQNRISTTVFTKGVSNAEIKNSYRLFTPNLRISSQFVIHKSGFYIAPTLFYSRAILLKRTVDKSIDEINPNPYFTNSSVDDFSLDKFGSSFRNNIVGYALELGLPLSLEGRNKSDIYFSFSETLTPLYRYNWNTIYRGNPLILGSGLIGRVQFALGYRYSFGGKKVSQASNSQ